MTNHETACARWPGSRARRTAARLRLHSGHLLPAFALVGALATLAGLAQESRPSPGPGPVVAIGGGKDVPAIVRRFVDLAGGPDARILVLAINTSQKNPGEAMAAYFRENGAKNVGTWVPKREAVDGNESLAALRAARGLYISGGDQTVGMALLQGTRALDVIRERHRAGAVIGGTSAGAAILSGVMIEGGKPEGPLTPKAVPTSAGLDLVGKLVLDQHFLARGRLPRLLNVLLDHPDHRGIGLDERTAAVIFADHLEIIGLGQAVVVELVAKPVSEAVDTRPLWRAPEMKLRVLLPGDSLPL